MKKIYLDNNNLVGYVSPEIANATQLEYLQLNHNQLSGVIPPEVCSLDLVNWASDFHNNKFCPPYPECSFSFSSQDTSECPECDEGEVNLFKVDCNSFPEEHSDGCMESGCYSIEETSYLNYTETDSTFCLLYTSPSPRDQRGSGMPSCA